MRHVVELSSPHKVLDVHLVIIFQFHGSVGIEAFPEIVHGLAELSWDISPLDHEDPWQLFLQFDLVRLVASRLFLYHY